MIKILITDKLAKEGIDIINATEGVEAVIKTGISEDELAKIIGEYDGLIIRSDTKVTAKVLANPGKFRAVARAGASGSPNRIEMSADESTITWAIRARHKDRRWTTSSRSRG